jgi:hypothetical protein
MTIFISLKAGFINSPLKLQIKLVSRKGNILKIQIGKFSFYENFGNFYPLGKLNLPIYTNIKKQSFDIGKYS